MRRDIVCHERGDDAGRTGQCVWRKAAYEKYDWRLQTERRRAGEGEEAESIVALASVSPQARVTLDPNWCLVAERSDQRDTSGRFSGPIL